MEVFNKFKSTLSTSVSNTVFSAATSLASAANSVSSVLPGNPVTREFEVIEHIASAGPGLIWKVYSGFKKSTKQSAAVFVLEKRSLDRFDKQERELLLDIYRKSISQLTRLRHPQILTVQHPLEESRDCLAFATEPVFASLANVLGRTENVPSTSSAIRAYKMFDVEIKYRLIQLCEGIGFLHDSVKMLHRNLCPESIVINHQGAWKIFGFDFCIPNSAPANQPPSYQFPEYDHTIPPEGYPDLDFLAPEYALTGLCTPAADLFSMGMIAFSLFNTKPLFVNSGNWGLYKKNAHELKNLRESNLQLIPSELKEYLKMLLNVTPELRPDTSQFSKIPFFDDVGVKTLNNLDSQFQWDNLQKSQFYKGLPQIIPRLPHRVSLHRVIPCLAKEFVNSHMIPFVLPSVLMIAEDSTNSDFTQYILPELKPVMKITDPIQILLIFMQRMEMLLSKTPPTDVKSDVLPMIYRALESNTSQIQELCLSIIPGFAGLLDYQAMKNALLPRIKKLCISTSLLSVRVNCLICIGKLLTHLDKWLVIDEILPMLKEIPSREPAVIMGIIGIVKMTMSDDKLGVTKEVIATKLLPFLFPLSIENGLTVNQYNTLINIIKELINRVENEHRIKLEQLNSIQNEQRSALKISMSESMLNKSGELIPSSTTTGGKKGELDEMFSGLGLSSFVEKKDSGALATNMMNDQVTNLNSTVAMTSSDSKHNLTLEDKQRMLKETERIKSTSSSMQKDLTSSLINSNLSQMKTSQSFNNGFQSPNYNIGSSSSSSSANFQMQQTRQATSMWNSNTMMSPNNQSSGGAAQVKPDLSAFDSLLPSKPKSSMNSMMTLNSNNGGVMKPTDSSPMMNMMINNQRNSNSGVKPLSPNDINDLLS